MTDQEELNRVWLEARGAYPESEGQVYARSRGVESWQEDDIGWVSEDKFLFRESSLRKIPKGSLVFSLTSPCLGLVGFCFRTLVAKVYGQVVIPGREVFPRFLGGSRALQEVFHTRSAVVVEGPFDQKALSLVKPQVLGLGTSVLSNSQKAYFGLLLSMLVVALDSDKGGQLGWEDIKNELDGVEKLHLRMPYKDPSKCLIEMGKESFVNHFGSLLDGLLVSL